MIKVFSSSLTIIIIIILLVSCKEENVAEPDYTGIMKNSEWYGLYQNNGETIKRSYALVINLDSTFSFYADAFTHEGSWSVSGKSILFRFAQGNKNQWSAEITSDTLKKITIPIPANFSFIGTAKKIGPPPGDAIGHVWKQKVSGAANPYSLTLTPLKMNFSKTGSAGLSLEYSSAPYKDKIFRSTPSAQIVVVDGETLWSTVSTYEWGEFEY